VTKSRIVFLVWLVLFFGLILFLPNITNAESRWDAVNQKMFSFIKQGDYKQALQVAKQSLEIAEKDYGPNHINTAKSLNNVGTILWDLGNFSDAEPLFKRALTISEKNMDDFHIGLLDQIGSFYEAQDKYSIAEEYFMRTFLLYRKKYSRHASEMTVPLNNLARIYKRQKKYSAALKFYKRKLYIEKKLGGPDSILVGYAYEDIADIYLARGQHSKALRTYERALIIREKNGNLNDEMGADLLESLSKTHSKISKDFLRRAQKIRGNSG
jgi:tetratricopeptide (TPR) repeat protein